MAWYINDLETQNHKWFGSLASPHCPQNYIVATGWAIDGGEVQHEYFDTPEQAQASDWLERGLKGQKMYVAHNATFEIHYLLKYYPDVFIKWINEGGRIFCTQYAEFLLTNQNNQYPKLEDCAVKYRDEGMDEHDVRKLDEVKILWEQGVLTADIDKELLLSYLCDDTHGDIANTRRVCFAQYTQLVQRGMWKMFQARMDSLLFNAFATFNGLYVNQPIAQRNLKAQMEAIDNLKAEILSQLPKDLPTELEFSFTSAYHRSAFLFGGDIKYRKKVSYDPIKFEKVNCYKFADFEAEYISIADFNSAEAVGLGDQIYAERGDFVRYKSGKNKGLPKEFLIDSSTEKLKWGDEAYTFTGLIDLKALPKHVSEQYVGRRAEFKGKRELVCGTPVYSTSGDSLDVLANFTDVAKPIKELATLQKDTGTYYLIEDDKGKVSGMLQYVEPDSIIHHQLNNCSTITARLSSSKPNFQNLPRADEDEDGNLKSRVKEMFTSRFGEFGRIVEVDYSALEVVALATISGDKNLMKMLIDGIDMHCYRLAAKLSEDYDEVKLKCKDQSHPDNARYSNMRTDIKPRAFAHQYGASAAGISFSTGCTLEEAEEFKAIEFQLFPESNAFPAKFVRPQVEATGNNSMPERECTDGVWSIFRRGFFQALSGTCYSFRQYPKRIEGQMTMDYKDTQIANYWCQGEASFIVQAACGRVIREFLKLDFFGGKALPINTVHDAIYLDCADEATAIEAGKLVQKIMEETPAWLAEQIPALKEWNYHITPFPAAGEQGASMAHKEHIH